MLHSYMAIWIIPFWTETGMWQLFIASYLTPTTSYLWLHYRLTPIYHIIVLAINTHMLPIASLHFIWHFTYFFVNAKELIVQCQMYNVGFIIHFIILLEIIKLMINPSQNEGRIIELIIRNLVRLIFYVLGLETVYVCVHMLYNTAI